MLLISQFKPKYINLSTRFKHIRCAFIVCNTKTSRNHFRAWRTVSSLWAEWCSADGSNVILTDNISIISFNLCDLALDSVFFACVCAGNTTVYETWSKTLDMTVCCLLMNFKSTRIVHERRGRARRSGRPGQCSLPSHHHHRTLTEDGSARFPLDAPFQLKIALTCWHQLGTNFLVYKLYWILCWNLLVAQNEVNGPERNQVHLGPSFGIFGNSWTDNKINTHVCTVNKPVSVHR